MNRVLFGIGMTIFLLPLGWRIWENHHQGEMIDTYWEEMEQVEETELLECLSYAQEYNSKWYQEQIFEQKLYEEQLNLQQDGMMGSIEISKIDVKLPIYHGTEEEVLSKGVGHLKESSLPVGGENTHSVLTGHRGLPQAQLFTRLDELEEGDLFQVSVCNQTFSYRVSKISVVEPQDTACLKIEAGKDLCSLITCTPYGPNTHRLVVTGERITDAESISEEIEVVKWSRSDLLLCLIPVMFLAAVIFQKGKRRSET